MRYGLKGVLSIGFGILLFAGPLRAGTGTPPSPDASAVVYRFEDHLNEAKTILRFKDKRNDQTGIWKDDAFLFSGTGAESDIRLVVETVNEVQGNWIVANPIADVLRRIQFQKVPPASALRLYYLVDTAEQKSEKGKVAAYFDFRIWAGQHEIKKIRVPVTKLALKKETLDLGPVAFLNRNINISFEIYSESKRDAYFGFKGELV